IDKIESLLQSGRALLSENASDAGTFADEALALSYETQYRKGIADSLILKSDIYFSYNYYEQSAAAAFQSLDIYLKLEDLENAAICYQKLGDAYHKIGDENSSLQYYLEALKHYKKTDNDLRTAFIYSRIGYVYQSARDYSSAIESLQHALKIYGKLADAKNHADMLYAIGNVYNWSDDILNAALYLRKSKDAARKCASETILMKAYSSLAILYTKTEDYGLSLEYFQKTHELADKLKDKGIKSSSLKSLGNLYNILGQYNDALKVLKEALAIATEQKMKTTVLLCHQFFTDTYEHKSDFKSALKHHKIYMELERKFFGEELKIKTKGLQVKFDLEEAKNENEIYRLKNIDLVEANEEINRQKTEIQTINKELTDSITYAQRIQHAILPNENHISHYLNDYFILYKPKAVVSGDFYWFSVVDHRIVFAVIDCTGHGVPGAFMSMIANDLLNQIVNEKKTIDPAAVLQALDEKIHTPFTQESADLEIQDGMDIAFCVLDLKNNFLEYAGANCPLWIINDGKMTKHEPHRCSIGGDARGKKNFQTKKIKIKKEDAIYFFTDGYTDQFGGKKGKKFSSKQLEQLLIASYNEPMNKQKETLTQTIESWKGNLEQVDDILLIGIKV
ncbi:MAG: tetratricopeptide repeat protein, partial [Bacteroidia bacterium]